jgi:hypothetical protein
VARFYFHRVALDVGSRRRGPRALDGRIRVEIAGDQEDLHREWPRVCVMQQNRRCLRFFLFDAPDGRRVARERLATATNGCAKPRAKCAHP